MDYPITIHHIYISDGHNYFGRPSNQPGFHPTHDVAEVQAIAGHGLQGDRFCGVRPDFDGQVTFFSLEVFQQLAQALAPANISTVDLRRNLIVEGVPLNQLIGQKFTIFFGDSAQASSGFIGRIEFEGMRHCNPCRWMDIGIAGGALKFLKGRGGLRAKICSSGLIQRGHATLSVATPLALDEITLPLAKPKLP